MDAWTNSGLHRLVSLKCGHLYGESCIDRWIKTNPKCPQCNRPSKRADIRRIYAKSIKVLDTFELDKALKSLDEERIMRKKAEIAMSEMRMQYQLATEECIRYKNEATNYKNLINRLKAGSSSSSSDAMMMMMSSESGINNHAANHSSNNHHHSASSISGGYTLDKLINITDISGCRTVTYSSRTSAILVSQPSNTAIFPGFGIKKINLFDYKLSQYIPVHSKLIRDIAINTLNDDGIALTCGVDKCIKLVNLTNNIIVHSYETTQPIWSCTYNLDNPIYFYAGLQNGQVLLFDKRKIDTHVSVLNAELAGSPCCSLQYVPRTNDSLLKYVLIFFY